MGRKECGTGQRSSTVCGLLCRHCPTHLREFHLRTAAACLQVAVSYFYIAVLGRLMPGDETSAELEGTPRDWGEGEAAPEQEAFTNRG